MRRALLAGSLLLASACGSRTDVGIEEMSARLVAATPEAERAAVSAELAALAALAKERKLGDVERRALLDLYRSAARDGALDEDERLLLVQFSRDLVAGSGSIEEKT